MVDSDDRSETVRDALNGLRDAIKEAADAIRAWAPAKTSTKERSATKKATNKEDSPEEDRKA